VDLEPDAIADDVLDEELSAEEAAIRLRQS
jgi:hypothetical protein